MSYDSSYLRTNSINFSSVSEDKQAALVASKHSKYGGSRSKTVHIIGIEHVDWFGPVPLRQTFSLSNGDGTEMGRDGDVPVCVNISV